MRCAGLTIMVAATLLTPGMASAGQPVSREALVAVLGDLDRQFTCPEFLPDDNAREAEREAFGRSLSVLKISYAQASHIRARMLDRHNCSSGVAAPAAASPAPVREATIALAGTTTGVQH